ADVLMCPRQIGYTVCSKLAEVRKGRIELPKVLEVGDGKALAEALAQITRQVDDELAHAPVGFDHRRIDGTVGGDASGMEDMRYVGEEPLFVRREVSCHGQALSCVGAWRSMPARY